MNEQSLAHAVSPEIIRIVVVDIDGCLSEGECHPMDLDLLRFIGDINERSRTDPLIPAVTYITGRNAQYLELLIQLTKGYQPGIYEIGGAALLPAPYRFEYNPSLSPQAARQMRLARDLLQEKLADTNQAYLQPGLELIISAYPLEPVTMPELKQKIQKILAPYQDEVVIEQARTCVDIIPRGINKGNGLRWLSRLTDVPLPAMAGIGDSDNDRSFLELVAFSAAPANAALEAKAAVDYVSPHTNGRGVKDFLDRCLRLNQERAQTKEA